MRPLLLSMSLLSATVVGIAGCGSRSSSVSAVAPTTAASPNATGWPQLIVYKSASCGCCALWVDHMKRAGFTAEVHNQDNVDAIKRRVGIPVGMGSCHTAQVGRYFVEGHVPAEDVKRLLAEQPDAKGLVVPRMPAGSPGMEVPSGIVEPYDVYLIANDGKAKVYAHHAQ